MNAIATAPLTPQFAPDIRRRAPLRLAGPAYVLAWMGGLAIASTGIAVDAEPAEVVRHYVASGGQALVQSLLIHGVAAFALVAVAWSVRQATITRDRTTARAAFVAATVAGALSLIQMVLGAVLATGSIGADQPARAAELFDALNRIDGFKMIALGLFIGAGAHLARRGHLPRWLAPIGALTVVLLAPAAVAYLTLNAEMAIAAAPALLGLLVWVASAGLAATRR